MIITGEKLIFRKSRLKLISFRQSKGKLLNLKKNLPSHWNFSPQILEICQRSLCMKQPKRFRISFTQNFSATFGAYNSIPPYHFIWLKLYQYFPKTPATRFGPSNYQRHSPRDHYAHRIIIPLWPECCSVGTE